MSAAMASTYKAVQIADNTGKFEVVTKPMPEPKEGEVLIKVSTCGVCHGDDAWVKGNEFMHIGFPNVPGHEVIGSVVKVGPNVEAFKAGDKVGVGWYGGSCLQCHSCRRGKFLGCDKHYTTGIRYEGGFGAYMCVPTLALAMVPPGLSDEEAAPLMCAGLTVYNALRSSGAVAGGVVAVQGIGGLGHLAIQFANKMGFRTVAISQSDRKKDLAMKMGAKHFINSSKQDVTQELLKLGGADVALVTSSATTENSNLVNGLANYGQLIVLGADMNPFPVSAMSLIMGCRALKGWASGTAAEAEDTMNFAVTFGIRPMVEVYPMEKAEEAYKVMMAGKANIRCVLRYPD